MRRLRIIRWFEFGTHYNIMHQIYQNKLTYCLRYKFGSSVFLVFENFNCLATFVGFGVFCLFSSQGIPVCTNARFFSLYGHTLLKTNLICSYITTVRERMYWSYLVCFLWVYGVIVRIGSITAFQFSSQSKSLKKKNTIVPSLKLR